MRNVLAFICTTPTKSVTPLQDALFVASTAYLSQNLSYESLVLLRNCLLTWGMLDLMSQIVPMLWEHYFVLVCLPWSCGNMVPHGQWSVLLIFLYLGEWAIAVHGMYKSPWFNGFLFRMSHVESSFPTVTGCKDPFVWITKPFAFVQ